MNNIYVQALDRCRYAEIYKPLYSAPHNIPLGVVNCGMARVFAGYTSEICNHKGFVLMFCTDGKGEIVVGNTAYPVNKGEFICYRSTQSRVVLNPKSDLWTYRWIEINGTSARFYYDRFNEQSFPHLTVNVMSEDIFNFQYNRICDNLSDTAYDAPLKCNAFLSELLNPLIISLQDADSYKDRFAKNFSALVSYVEKNYFTDITVEQMADVFSLSKYHFIRIFKEYLGITPMKYVRNLRIAKASELLLRTDRTVDEIAEITGYSTTTGFIENFKAVQGTTPLKYRKNNK